MKTENQKKPETDAQKKKNNDNEKIRNESNRKWLPSSDKLYIFKRASFDSSLVQCIYLPEKA